MANYASFISGHLDVRMRSGHEWQCLCPFHEDSNPSFSINVRKGLYICYACGAKGNIDDLSEHLGTVATDSGTTIDDVKTKIQEYKNYGATTRSQVLLPHDASVLGRTGDYHKPWANRGIVDQEVLDFFRLGYSIMDNSLIIPLMDWNGAFLGNSVRLLDPQDGGPKYKYPHGLKISEILYGAWQVRTHHPVSSPKILAVTEGAIDTLTLWQAGIPSVALLGANISVIQANRLVRLDPVEIIILTDRDVAGRRIAMEIPLRLKALGSSAIISEPTWWPEGAKDVNDMNPDQLLRVITSRKWIKSNLLDK